MPPILLNLRFTNRHDCPYIPKTHDEKQWLEKQWQALAYFKTNKKNSTEANSVEVNSAKTSLTKASTSTTAKSNPAHPNTVSNNAALTREQYDYLKQMGHVVIFIHGYNVPLGDYGRQLMAVPCPLPSLGVMPPIPCPTLTPNTIQQVRYKPFDDPTRHAFCSAHFRLEYGDAPATFCRDAAHIRDAFSGFRHWPNLSDESLNGTGAHNWALHMEENFNRVLGFEGFDFHGPSTPAYQRLLTVSWLGDPSSALDYLAIEPLAAISGRALVSTLQRLKAQGNTLTVIAHSAGCIVLLQAMAYSQTQQKMPLIDHAVFWQAAMPNAALSPRANSFDQSPNRYWQTESAYQAAKRCHILFSRHDQVLGPLPLSSQGINYREKGEEALMSQAIYQVDHILKTSNVPRAIRSVYYLAQLVGVPMSALLNDSTVRTQVYQRWATRLRHTPHKAVIEPTLMAQQCALTARYPHLFNHLTLFIGLYYAISNDGVFHYLSQSATQQKLAQFIYDMGDFALSRLQNALHLKPASHTQHLYWQFLIDFLKSPQPHPQKPVIQYFHRLAKLYFLKWIPKTHGSPSDRSTYLFHKCQEHIFCQPGVISPWQPLINPQTLSAIQSLLYSTKDIHTAYTQNKSPKDKPDQGKTISTKHTQDKSSQEKYPKDRDTKNKNQHTIVHSTVFQQAASVATLLITFFMTSENSPRDAMGYTGPLRGTDDPSMEALIRSNRVQLIDQTDYLMHHSAMKIPTPVVQARVYKGLKPVLWK